MTPRHALRAAGLSTAFLLAVAGAARADAIDGHWCRADGKRMSIRGPEIVTPGGTHMQGSYLRHYFEYVVPSGEPGAGDKVFIQLLSETLAHARQGEPDAPVQVWNRCQPDIS